MNFSEKISKIVDTNKLGINSPSKLEEYIGAGRGSITQADQESGPGKATQKKIIEKLRINQEWWTSGSGSIYLDAHQQNSEPMKILPLDAWELFKNNFSQFEQNSELVKSEVLFLRELIRNLTRNGVDSNKV